jgi:hypothetical protein
MPGCGWKRLYLMLSHKLLGVIRGRRLVYLLRNLESIRLKFREIFVVSLCNVTALFQVTALATDTGRSTLIGSRA